MGFDRRTATLTVPNPAATITQTLNLRSEYIRPMNFKIYSDTADAQELRVKDGDGRIWWLDAADKDYNTAAIYTLALLDDVQAVGGIQASDAVGIEVAAAQHSANPVLKNPLEVAIINGAAGTTTTFDLDYEYGIFAATEFVLPTAASNTATLTRHLKSKYAQICGIKALSTGTSVTLVLEIKDADGKIIYKDSGARSYKTTTWDAVITVDATVTGLTQVVPRGASGAAIQAGVGRADNPMVRSPLTLTITEAEGNDEVLTATVYYRTG